jgi:hypothetical protein
VLSREDPELTRAIAGLVAIPPPSEPEAVASPGAATPSGTIGRPTALPDPLARLEAFLDRVLAARARVG